MEVKGKDKEIVFCGLVVHQKSSEILTFKKGVFVKMEKLRKGAGVSVFAILVAILFAGSLALAAEEGGAKDQGVGPSKNWTEKQFQEFSKKPWTKEQLEAMGRGTKYIICKTLIPRHTGKVLTPKELLENGEREWLPIMCQYGIGISAADFYKLWIEQEGWKNPKIHLLDVRMESEFAQGHIPGSVRLDEGLAYWLLPSIAPDSTADYYLYCKAGTPDNGAVRGAIVKKIMIDMGYSGKITVITDGFRGWIEGGYPIVSMHGMFTLVPGTFQIPEKDAMQKAKEVTPVVEPAVMEEGKKLGVPE